MPERKQTTALMGGTFSYPSRSLVGRAVASGIVWDQHLVEVVRRLPPGAFVCEVGSNIGASLVTMAMARPDLKFICFEASARFLPYLEANVLAFGLADRVIVEPRFVGPDGEEWLLNSNTTTGSAAAGSYDGHIHVQQEVKRAIALDSYFEGGRELPALVKIDTDGFDARVVASMTSLMAASHPTLSIEYSPALLKRVGDTGDGLRESLLRAGYRTADTYLPDGTVQVRAHDLCTALSTDSYLDLVVHGTGPAGR